MPPVTLGYNLVALSMTLLHHLPRRGCRALLAGLRMVMRLTLKFARKGDLETTERVLLDGLPQDERTVLRQFDLDAVTTSFVCCPSCYALYPIRSCPSVCSSRPTPHGSTCGSALWHSQTINGKAYSYPQKTYLHQSMKHWMARFLSHPGIEPLVDSRKECAWMETPDVHADVWDAPRFSSIQRRLWRAFH